MAYNIGQENQVMGIDSSEKYAEEIKSGTIQIQDNSADEEATGIIAFSFGDPYLKLNSSLETGIHYYVHAKVYRLPTVQQFDIKLINSTDASLKQYIKTATINMAVKPDEEEPRPNMDEYFADVEFIFTPLIDDFDGILFELKRNKDDMIYDETTNMIIGRKPLIAFIEVSKIKDVKPVQKSLPKIGVQSRPSLMMCINGEEIHVSRTGIFELRDGIVPVTFFSVVNGATLENSTNLDTQMNGVYDGNITNSIAFLSENKKRIIDSYTLDYLYQSSESE